MARRRKTIMIFGGGINQLTLIETANGMGLRTVVLDPDPSACGRDKADVFEVVGAADYETTKSLALKYRVNGIITSQMENPLMLMARLAADAGFIFPEREVIARCRNKYMMKKAFQAAAVPRADGILFHKEEEIGLKKVERLGFPLIIKPVDAHSSRGVFRVNDFAELKRFENKTRSFSGDGSVIAEEFIDGKEYSVESLTCKGITEVIQITEKIVTPFPYTVETGHIQPADLSREETDVVRDIVVRAIEALGIDNSASHTELKLSSHGPVIIETGARLGGDFISSYLTTASTGINMEAGAISVCLGEKPLLTGNAGMHSIVSYPQLPSGKEVLKILPYDDLVNNPDIVFFHLYISEGSVIPEVTHSAQRPVCVIMKNQRRETLLGKMKIFDERIRERILLN